MHFTATLLLACAALTSSAAWSKHVVLSWKPFTDSPANHGYWRVYGAPRVMSNDPHPVATFTDQNELIATWNSPVFKDQTLSFTTPCGTRGYGNGHRIPRDGCAFLDWMMCIGHADRDDNPISCFGMDKHDDGEWPNPFAKADVPIHVEVWVKRPHNTYTHP